MLKRYCDIVEKKKIRLKINRKYFDFYTGCSNFSPFYLVQNTEREKTFQYKNTVPYSTYTDCGKGDFINPDSGKSNTPSDATFLSLVSCYCFFLSRNYL